MNKKVQSNFLTIPNCLSFFRIALIPIIVWLYIVKHEYWWAGGILILSGLTDLLDGYIARKYQLISDLGKVLDPIADKLTQFTVFICLLTRFPLMIIPLILLVVKESFATISGYFVVKRVGEVFMAKWHGKISTMFANITVISHVFFPKISISFSHVMIMICTGMMSISFVLYAIRDINALILAKHAINKNNKI